MLQKILIRHLEPYFVPARGTVTQYYSLRPMVADCGVLLSAMAYAGHKSDTEAKAAFGQGAQSQPKPQFRFSPKPSATLLVSTQPWLV
jgi:hypothetical protein